MYHKHEGTINEVRQHRCQYRWEFGGDSVPVVSLGGRGQRTRIRSREIAARLISEVERLAIAIVVQDVSRAVSTDTVDISRVKAIVMRP